DGLVLYREAPTHLVAQDPDLRDATAAFPVFDVVAAYRLQPESLRWLSRQLHLRRVDELFGVPPPSTPEPTIALTLAEDDVRKTAFLAGDLSSVATMVLHVVNAIVPPGHPFRLPDLFGGGTDP